MISSSDIRKDNKKRIYKLMLTGGVFTKHRIAAVSGLSVATCNTLLNDMAEAGLLLPAEEKELRGIGRGSVRYQVNGGHESYLAVRFPGVQGKIHAEFVVLSALGEEREVLQIEEVCLQTILTGIEELLQRYPEISCIALAIPGIIVEDEIVSCEIPRLEKVGMKAAIEKRTALPVILDTDLHFMGCGAYVKGDDLVRTLGFFPEHLLPGLVTMHRDQLITGGHGSAGLIGFLPIDTDGGAEQSLADYMVSGKCLPVIKQIIGAAAAFLDPDEILLSGKLITEEVMAELAYYCERKISKLCRPRLIRIDDFSPYLMRGIFWKIVEEKKF